MVFRISKIHTNADFTFSNNKLKAKGEKKIDLTFSFRNEKDFSYLSFPDGEPNNSITVKGIVLK